MAGIPDPKISINKLAEYIVSKGKRQRQILSDQKFPSEYKGMYYREAAESIAMCLSSNLEDLSSLERQKRILEQITADKIGTQRRIASNIDAIETFETMLDSIDLMGAELELGAHQAEPMMYSGVRVSVRPEIVLRGTGKGGRKLLGAAKLHFPRTFSLTEESAGYVSSVLQEYCKARLIDDEEVYGPYCFVIDVGSGTIYPGVKSTVARLNDVTSECRNIAGLWGTIAANE